MHPMNNIFIQGESIDLCVPNDDDFNIWYTWFNSKHITRFLEQGKIPNSKYLQIEYYKKSIENGRFVVVIKGKEGNLLGVISLSEINYERSSCQIALVCPVVSRESRFAALEAMALVTDHAFIRLGIERVWASQVFPELKKWTQKLEIIGYKVDGFGRKSFRHGIDVSDSVNISIIKSEYLELSSRRSGSIWPGKHTAEKMLMALKKQPILAIKLHKIIKESHKKQELFLKNTELSVCDI